MFDSLSEVTDMFRTSMPFSIIYFLPLILMFASNDPRMLAHASQEFQVYRMQQFDMPSGNHFGSQANLLNMEARTINSKASFISRRCVLVKLDDFTLERYRILVSQYAGSILVILPNKGFNSNQMQIIKSLETQLLHEEVKLPVYFIHETKEVLDYYETVDKDKSSQADSSALQALVDSIIANGFQFVINSPQSKPIAQTGEYQVVNLQAKLNGGDQAVSSSTDDSKARNNKIPTIIITAHYDTFGMATSLSYGCDSNGSGVIALLELARILSYLYSSSRTIPSVNILFLLTTEGKFNYHGLKKWIEEQSEANEMVGKIDLDDVLFAICLDSLGKPIRVEESQHNGLYMHVSRPPKEGQPTFELFKSFEKEGNKSDLKFEMIHKKINLASETLAWEHERFSLNKIPAMTLSHFQSHKDADRATMTDTLDTLDKKALLKNIRFLANSLISFIYRNNENIPEHLLTEELDTSEEAVSSWLSQLCSVPRSASLLTKNHPLVANFFSHFNHYLQETIKLPVRVQTKEPEFVFFNEEQATLVIYNVKPAAFDLLLTLAISAYIGAVYFFILNFNQIFSVLNKKLLANRGSNTNGVKAQK